MAFTTRQAASEQKSAQEAAAKPSAQLFSDQRASTSVQLKQQQLMQTAQLAAEEEEPLQGKFVAQRVEEEEPLQGKFETAQLAAEEEEPLQGKFATAQLAGMEEEVPMQGKFATAQLAALEEEPLQGKFVAQRAEEEEPLQGKFESPAPAQREQKPNNTGMPDNLKSGIENLSGYSMDDVKVHYNSDKPAQLNAHAYAQGTDIHVAPGQEQHLPHEAWHVVQQKQGRVQATMQMKAGVPVNDDAGLENEADVMGARALQNVTLQKKTSGFSNADDNSKILNFSSPIQMFDPLKTPRHTLNANGKAAFDLLDNGRAEFKKIDKSGGDTNAVQDSKNRVIKASKQISNKAEARDQALQTTIGWLGNLEEENVSAGYNGGHLIASSLGGSGTWQNMVPQDGPENKWGDWRKYEKENKAAITNTGSPLIVTVQLGYSGDSVLPSSWDSWLTDKNGIDVNWYSATFK